MRYFHVGFLEPSFKRYVPVTIRPFKYCAVKHFAFKGGVNHESFLNEYQIQSNNKIYACKTRSLVFYTSVINLDIYSPQVLIKLKKRIK